MDQLAARPTGSLPKAEQGARHNSPRTPPQGRSGTQGRGQWMPEVGAGQGNGKTDGIAPPRTEAASGAFLNIRQTAMTTKTRPKPERQRNCEALNKPSGDDMGRQKTSEPDVKRYSGRFAKRIVALRKAAKLEVKELADKLGVSKFTVYAWENGSNFPTADTLPDLAKALGCKTVGDLMPPK